MKTSLIAAAAAFLLAAVPAIAGEVYQSGPATGLHDNFPSANTGSAQYQSFNGPSIGAFPDQVVAPSGTEAEPNSLNSAPLGAIGQ